MPLVSFREAWGPDGAGLGGRRRAQGRPWLEAWRSLGSVQWAVCSDSLPRRRDLVLALGDTGGQKVELPSKASGPRPQCYNILGSCNPLVFSPQRCLKSDLAPGTSSRKPSWMSRSQNFC